MQDDDYFFRDGPPSPQDRPSSPGPDKEPESYPQPQPPAPEASRRRAVAHVRPISIADIVRDVSGPDPMRVVQDFDRIYMPEGGVTVHSVVAGQPGEARRSVLKRKAANITRSHSEVFAMLTSSNSSFDCALVSVIERHDRRLVNFCNYFNYCNSIIVINLII